MIVTLTLNPALDKSTEMEKLVPEKKMRCKPLLMEAGGGGINISKAIQELGGESIAIFPSGGWNGKLVESLLSKQGITCHAIPIEEETRENFVATEIATNKQYRFVMPGPALQAAALENCKKFIDELDPVPSFLIASGSLPPGVPDNFLAELADMSKQKGIKMIVDTSGPALLKAMEHGLYLLKPNLSELCSLVDKNFLELSEIDDAAREVIEKSGCEVVVASMGPEGAMLVTKDYTKRIIAPSVKKISTVGAGDSMVAGMVWMLEKNEPLEQAVMFGVACGTAATMNKGTQLFNKNDVERLYNWLRLNSPK